MSSHRRRWVVLIGLLLCALPNVLAQGTLADYQRAQQLLPGNLRHRGYVADVLPHWIEKTNRFWYETTDAKGSEFLLVDAEQNTSGPAFDHARQAAVLSIAAKQEYSVTALPFYDIEFVDGGKAPRFSIDPSQTNSEAWL